MNPASAFEGRGFVVTGGTRGLGKSIVLAAARLGANVLFCGRPDSSASGDDVLAEAEAAGAKGRVSYIAADVAKESDVDSLFEAAADRLPSLNVVINNAGIRKDRLLVETSLSDWNDVLAVNLRGPFLVSRRAVEELLMNEEGGRIINISSVTARGAVGQASYAASKAALLSLTRCIAKEYGRRKILCNAVVPSYLESEMTAEFQGDARRARENLSPQRRFGRVDEVADSVMFLASEDSSFVNGDALFVSGAIWDFPDFRS